MQTKYCPNCGLDKEASEDNFYRARPRVGHKKEGWQSYCKPCWPLINKANKMRMAELKNAGK